MSKIKIFAIALSGILLLNFLAFVLVKDYDWWFWVITAGIAAIAFKVLPRMKPQST